MTSDTVFAAAFTASMSLNVGLILRGSQVGKLKEWLTGELAKHRTGMRHDLLLPTMQVADLHSDISQIVARKHPDLFGKLPRPLIVAKLPTT